MQHGILIFNPRSGRRGATKLASSLVPVLRRAGFALEPRPTSGPGDATRLARSTHDPAGADVGARVVFVLGGDGTLREAAAGLVGSDVPLGFLPAGTVNVMSRALGLPRRPHAVARMAHQLVPRRVDVGRCDEDVFLMMASAGLDAAVMKCQRPALKRFLGRSAVVATGVGAWWRYSFSPMQATFNGRTESATLAAACNIPYYGGGFRLAPEAAMTDGQLDLVLFRGSGRLAALALARDVACGRHLDRDDIQIHRISSATLELPTDVALQVDGDPVDHRPPDHRQQEHQPRARTVRVAVEPAALRLLMPPR